MNFDYHSFLDITFRSAIVYLFMILAFRIFGKRELSQLSIGDLVLIVLISNAVQNAMVGENTTLSGGLTAAAVLFTLNKLLNYLMFRFKGVRNLVQPEPVMLIYNGKILSKNLKSVMITEEELMQAIREHGIADVQHVNLSMLEPDGNISIISGNETNLKKTQYRRKKRQKTLIDGA